jgi:hypothetical protein
MCSYVVIRHIPENITKTLGAIRMLTLAKPSNGIWFIIVGEVFYQLMSKTFASNFAMHLSLIYPSPVQGRNEGKL